MITSVADLAGSAKEEMVASLALLLAGFGGEAVDGAKLVAIADASGNSLSSGIATLFASVASKADGGIIKAYMPPPGGGGGGGGGAAAAAGPAAVEEAKPEEEEEEAEIGGGMDMFGGGEAKEGGGDY